MTNITFTDLYDEQVFDQVRPNFNRCRNVKGTKTDQTVGNHKRGPSRKFDVCGSQGIELNEFGSSIFCQKLKNSISLFNIFSVEENTKTRP